MRRRRKEAQKEESMKSNGEKIRQPRFADDRWYSSGTAQLQQDLREYLGNTPPNLPLEDLIGLVAPHAGHFFSGHVAGAAFATLTAHTFDTVILLGPDHKGVASGEVATLDVAAWQTPLGDIPVDWQMLDSLRSDIEVQLLPTDDEHSLEIELPFLQMTLTDFKLAPLIMGDQTPQSCRRLGQAMARVMQHNGNTLLVASSDLSHFFDDETARQLDESTLRFVLDMDADGLIEHVTAARRRGEPLACGAGPIAAIIHAAKALGATQAHLLKYATSADVHPRKESVVGYAAVAIGK
jgi:AmmeMemoRadiSam system protein B